MPVFVCLREGGQRRLNVARRPSSLILPHRWAPPAPVGGGRAHRFLLAFGYGAGPSGARRTFRCRGARADKQLCSSGERDAQALSLLIETFREPRSSPLAELAPTGLGGDPLHSARGDALTVHTRCTRAGAETEGHLGLQYLAEDRLHRGSSQSGLVPRFPWHNSCVFSSLGSSRRKSLPIRNHFASPVKDLGGGHRRWVRVGAIGLVSGLTERNGFFYLPAQLRKTDDSTWRAVPPKLTFW